MAATCPGVFAIADEPQPLFDLILLDNFDPTSRSGSGRDPMDNPLRALGIMGWGTYQITSPSFPGMIVEQTELRFCPDMKSDRTRAFWGQLGKISSSLPDRFGGDGVSEIRHGLNDNAREFIVSMAMLDYVDLKHQEAAALRDKAKTRHGRFGKRELGRLRDSFLSNSLDISSLSRDLPDFIRYASRPTWGAAFYQSLDLESQKWEAEQLRPYKRPTPMGDVIGQELSKRFADLAAFDKDYRDILSTVASLGASIDAFKVQRYALLVAFTSLTVALITLIVTGLGPDGTTAWLEEFREWLSRSI
jgi:hypothetical protein